MRVLVLYAHPVETSFQAALHRRVVEALTRAGHAVDDCDLYAEAFEPLLTREERLGYDRIPENRATVADHVDRLLAAEALVIVSPIWNFGFPAILKGWFDRVMLPGVSFRLVDGKPEAALTNIRAVLAFTSYGSPRWGAMLMGDPPRLLMRRWLRAVIKPWAPVRYHGLYDMNRATQRQRERFLGKVERRVGKL
jgi:putative NADPH-quinone reductase